MHLVSVSSHFAHLCGFLKVSPFLDTWLNLAELVVVYCCAWQWLTKPRPEMQRFLVLLIFTWMVNFFVFEPLLLALHLVVGEPTLGDAWMHSESVYGRSLIEAHVAVQCCARGLWYHIESRQIDCKDLLNLVWKLFMVQVRFVSWLCGPELGWRFKRASRYLPGILKWLTGSVHFDGIRFDATAKKRLKIWSCLTTSHGPGLCIPQKRRDQASLTL